MFKDNQELLSSIRSNSNKAVMDSEDSHDGSSGNESNDEGCQTPVSTKSQGASSTKSNVSRSRSSSPESRVQSALSQHSQELSQDTSHFQKNSPHSPEGHNSAEDSYHSKNNSPHSLEDSQHSLDESQHSQEDRCHSPVNNHSAEGKESSDTKQLESPKSIVEAENSPEHKQQSSNEQAFSDHSPANRDSVRDSSPESHHSFNSSDSKHPSKESNTLETSPQDRSNPPTTKIRSRSRSNSSSDDNDEQNSKSSGNHIPKSPNSYKDSYINSTNSNKSNNLSNSPDYKHRSIERSTSQEKIISKADKSDDDDDESIKSGSSSSSRSVSSKGSGKSITSGDSRSIASRRSRRSRKKSDSSVSSDSSRNSSRNKGAIKSDTHAEEISDGDMESDQENDSRRFKEEGRRPEIHISHEDLSDVSDLEESLGGNLDNEEANEEDAKKDDEPGEFKSTSPDTKQIAVKNKGTEEGEEQLDFEAEDGECGEEQIKEKDDSDEKTTMVEQEPEKPEEKKETKELEEGEVTDEDDVRPEETEPRPVCRFFSRGQCTWGASCRFLHPGVTDKGNYTMFELIRPVVPGEFGREERIYGKPEPPLIESAWERGLRTAKEMLRKSVKRKEQDIDFEEKKMNLSLAQEEFDKENGYYGRVPSPEPRYVRHIPAEYPMARPSPEEYYGRRQIHYEPEYAPLPARERVRPYRELPPHRMPDYYNNKYEEEPSSNKRPKPKREVIVQRVEERQGRGDEWSDPWMRSKSPAGRRKDSRKRSYSSGSSYSTSSSSRSSTDSSRSTYRSRSRSSHRRRRSRSRRSRQVSPSVIVSERKAANERAALMNPPAPKRRAPSPGMMRVSGAANPPAPSRDDLRRSRSKLAAALARVKSRKSSRSSSGSSGSSSSDSDSSDSSSSSSRDESSPRRPAGVEISIAKAMDALKSGGLEKNKIKLNLKNPVGMKKNDMSDSRKSDQGQGKKRPASSPPGDPKSKKATSRREELLKQLKAVEDAIAKKRSKVI